MTSAPPIPSFPTSAITFPSTPLIHAALSHTTQHTTPTTINHTLRSAAFALIALKKLPHLASASADLVVLACILHDMGWSKTKSLLSVDKRFEVDGADLGRAWMRENGKWGEREEQLLWDAIALHTTPSIAMYKEPVVCAVAIGIAADFFGYKFAGPLGLFTFEEQKEIVAAFPRLGFSGEVVRVMCGLCREKAETTYDNFVGGFGVKYGLDGEGRGREEYGRVVEERAMVNGMMGVLRGNEEEERACELE